MNRPGTSPTGDERPWMVVVSEGRVVRLWRSTLQMLDRSARETTIHCTAVAVYRVEAGLLAPPDEGQPVNPLERGWQRVS
jgi:hypothetical protein